MGCQLADDEAFTSADQSALLSRQHHVVGCDLAFCLRGASGRTHASSWARVAVHRSARFAQCAGLAHHVHLRGPGVSLRARRDLGLYDADFYGADRSGLFRRTHHCAFAFGGAVCRFCHWIVVVARNSRPIGTTHRRRLDAGWRNCVGARHAVVSASTSHSLAVGGYGLDAAAWQLRSLGTRAFPGATPAS